MKITAQITSKNFGEEGLLNKKVIRKFQWQL